MKKVLSLFFAVIFIVSLVGCAGQSDAEINVTVLSGTTGMGAAKLISDTNAGKSELNCKFSIVSDATQISAGILGGSTDIAAVPTNLASTLYKKTGGNVYILAINTLGVLYIVENGNSVTDIRDLAGKTVYIPGQGTNPEYILKHVLDKNGISDVKFDYSYNTPDTLAAAVTGGLADIALLPEPKVTAVKAGNDKIRTAVNVMAEWDKVSVPGSLVQGCIIARKEFADAHPEEIVLFLGEYKKSIEYATENVSSAAELIAEAGIIPKAALAEKALPNCNIKYIDGDDMKSALSEFYRILYGVEPSSIGGAIPGDDIYYKK